MLGASIFSECLLFSVQLRIRDFGNLRHGDMFMTEPFELDGIQW